MELRESFLGFKFLSKESGRLFFLLLNEDPKKEVLDQNERAMNIKPKDIAKTTNKVIDYIKMRLKYTFENSGKASGTNYRKRDISSQKKELFPTMIINDKKGEYLDTSKIPEIELLVNNIEIDDSDSSVLLFTEKNLDYEKCKKLIKKYDNMENNATRRRNTPNIPVNIIDKDCTNIINKNAYIEIMVKNGKRDSRLSSLSRMTSERTTVSESNSEDKNRRMSYNMNPTLKYKSIKSPNNIASNNIPINNKMNAKSVDKENKGHFAKDKRKINSMQSTEMFGGMDDEDDGDLDKGGFNYFTNDDKNSASNKKNDIKKGVDIIEERPEDEEKDREHKYKKREIKLPNKYMNNITTNNIKTNNATNNISAKANIYKRPIAGKGDKASMSNFLTGSGKK